MTSSTNRLNTMETPQYQYHALNQTAPSPRDPTIRHAGRAHIRGKIRRVWRPRYLELCDSGLLRYYELPPTADVTLPEDSDWDHVNMIPKDSLVIFHARIIDVTTLRDLHVGLPKGSFGFLFRGQRQCHLELQQTNLQEPPREYFCAVSTLEEAQTWVIVLQWAASVSKFRHERSFSSGSFRQAQEDDEDDVNRRHQQHARGMHFLGESCQVPSSSSKQRNSSGVPRREMAFDVDSAASANSSSGIYTAATTESHPHTAMVVKAGMSKHSQSQHCGTTIITKRAAGRIVVTKVDGYQLVRVPTSALLLLEWQVAYEIGVLLIQGTKVEERRLLRTTRDLSRLLEELERELDSKISLTLVEEWKSKLATRPLSPIMLREFSNVAIMVPQLVSTFSFVDKMLRALAMDANIVNSEALKHCLVLEEDRPLVRPSKWWKSISRKEWDTSLTIRKVVQVPEDDTDSFVKKWLSVKKIPPNDWKVKTLIWALQRPWMVLGGAGVGLALSMPLVRMYQQTMVSISLRLDVLMGSWCIAAYLGKEYWATQEVAKQPPQRRPLLSPKSIPSQSSPNELKSTVVVTAPTTEEEVESSSVDSKDDLDYVEQDGEDTDAEMLVSKLSSPLPQYPQNGGESCWSVPPDNRIFRVRGENYLEDRVKIPSGPSPFKCRGVDVWLTDNPERHIARHPSVLDGKLDKEDTFLVNFLLPFGNFVSYFTVPPLSEFPNKLGNVWSKFVEGDQQYRDARLKLLPVVMDGPWIVKAAVGNGTAPALLGKVIPLQYFFHKPAKDKKAVFEVDVIITASSIAKGILSVVKGHTKSLTIAFAFIIEAAEQKELPETVLCAFQVHQLHLEDCPHLPECNLDEVE